MPNPCLHGTQRHLITSEVIRENHLLVKDGVCAMWLCSIQCCSNVLLKLHGSERRQMPDDMEAEVERPDLLDHLVTKPGSKLCSCLRDALRRSTKRLGQHLLGCLHHPSTSNSDRGFTISTNASGYQKGVPILFLRLFRGSYPFCVKAFSRDSYPF